MKDQNVLTLEMRCDTNREAQNRLESAAWDLLEKFTDRGMVNTRFASTRRDSYSLEFTGKENDIEALRSTLSLSEDDVEHELTYSALTDQLNQMDASPKLR